MGSCKLQRMVPLAVLVIVAAAIFVAAVRLFMYGRYQGPGGEVQIHMELGRSHFESGDLERALQEFESVIRANQDYVDAYVWLGTVRRSRREYEAAIKNWERALELAPANWADRAKVQRDIDDLRSEHG